MIPILYEKTETAFTSNGICRLPDMISGTVTEERNGVFIAEFEYPVEGRYFSEIKIGRIIYCTCSQGRKQPFEIYESSKPINGRVIFYARHLTYRANFIPVTPCDTGSSVNAATAMNLLKTNAMIQCDITFESTTQTLGRYKQNEVAPLRGRLGGVEGSILDVYGGEYEWGYDLVNHRPKVKLWENRGVNSGVNIRYGKNLTDLKQDESIENMITGVVLFYKDDTTCVYSAVKQRNVGGDYTSTPRIGVVDVSGNYEEPPTVSELNDEAEAYLNTHDIGIPEISLDISFVNLADTEEYKNVAVLETVNLCDTVTVIFEKLGVNATAKVVKTVWNFLLDRYDSLELGNSKTNISTVIAVQDDAINEMRAGFENVPSMVDVQSAINNATERITGNSGGYVVIEENEYGYPEEILIMDEPVKEDATAIWRWNKNGLGFSKSYSSMPYSLALTVDENGDGYINADYITGGEIDGSLISADSIEASMIKSTSLALISQEEQYIYHSKVDSVAPDVPTDSQQHGVWVTDSTGGQNKWTTVRPQFDKTKPICFIAKQRKDANGDVTTTTPKVDETTTVIDGGHITTGLISSGNGINTINMDTGAFSLANGNFKYDAVQAKPYIELLSNLSLRLNTIPLAGNHYHYKNVNGTASGDSLTWDSGLIGKNLTIEIDLVAMPYMTLMMVDVSIPSGSTAFAGNIATGFPTEARSTRAQTKFPLGELLNSNHASGIMYGGAGAPTGRLYLVGISATAYLNGSYGGSICYYTGA